MELLGRCAALELLCDSNDKKRVEILEKNRLEQLKAGTQGEWSQSEENRVYLKVCDSSDRT